MSNKSIHFGTTIIGEGHPCYVISEIGVNHGGDMDLCKRMILESKAAGANAVKFQTFTADTLVSQNTPKVKYQEATTDPNESHYEMIKKLEFSYEDHKLIYEFCKKEKIEFISTPYDPDSVDFLEELGVKIYKTASADLTDFLLHNRIIQTGKPVIIATGMSTLGEIESLLEFYRSKDALDRVLLLHCVSNYPCSDEAINLRSMKVLREAFQLPVGYSDHSLGSLAAGLSISLGACLIEKHFTTDKSLKGPDHKASSTPEEFKELVDNIRRSELILGEQRKFIRDEEVQMSKVSRKSIFTNKKILKGQVIEMEDLKFKRPGTGLKGADIFKIIGRKAILDIAEDTIININWIE